MSIGSALSIATSGLRVNQDGLSVVAGNIANSETEGFTRRQQVVGDISAGNSTIGVRTVNIERAIDEEIQSQLRDFAAVNVSNQIQSDFLTRLDVAFGQPGSPTAIDTGFNTALSSLEALAATPDDPSTQVQAVTDLQVFLGQLNNLSNTIQGLRSEADTAIAETVAQANDAIRGISELNSRIASSSNIGFEQSALLDERDRLVDELAQIVDIQVDQDANGAFVVRTTSGVSLVENQAFLLEFDRAGTVVPQSTLENGLLSTITVRAGGTFAVDLLGSSQLQEGALAAYTQLRDVTLVEAQAQLDEFAAQLALAVSNVDVPSTAVAGGQSIDTTGISDGNTVSLSFTDSSGTAQNVTLVQVSDPSQLPLNDNFTANPNDRVFGVDLSSPTAQTDIQAFLDTLTPAAGEVNVGGTALSFDFTSTAPVTVNDLSASITSLSAEGGNPAFPLFIDGGTADPFTNALNDGPGLAGFAGRIQLSQQVQNDPSLLSRFNAGSGNTGDSTRVEFILDQIRNETRTFSPSTGIGSAASPVVSTAEDFLQSIISRQGQQTESIQRQADASQLSFNNVQERFQAESAVNIDEEVARLIELEQAFQANARVLQTIQDLIDALLAI